MFVGVVDTIGAAAEDGIDAVGSVIEAWWPTGAVIGVAIGLHLLISLLGARRRARRDHQQRVMNSLLLVGVSITAVIAAVMVLPIGDSDRAELLSLLGIVLSATIALSSTTFVGNAMAGLMLRGLKNVKPGDFVRVGDVFGRVSEQGLLHTEVQTEERQLVTLPNLHLVTHPVHVLRSSGTVVAADVSLGYDVSRLDIERALLSAATSAGLSDPFVYVTALGDFSVSYRISGILEDVPNLLSTQSRLRVSVLDTLHAQGIEIVSPVFHNQRRLSPDAVFIPAAAISAAATGRNLADAPADRIFDKAEQAAAELQQQDGDAPDDDPKTPPDAPDA